MKSLPGVKPWEAAREDQGKNGQASQQVSVLSAERSSARRSELGVYSPGWFLRCFPVLRYFFSSQAFPTDAVGSRFQIQQSLPWGFRKQIANIRRSNQAILKEINPEYSLEGLTLKLKLHTLTTWYEELAHSKRPWCWERLKAGGEGDDKGWDGWMASVTQRTWVWTNSGR